MTKLEKKVLKRVLLRSEGRRLLPYETVSQKSDEKFRAFRKKWNEPEDFSESFQYVIDKLPPKEKHVLFRKYEDGASFAEIAKELNTATSVVQLYEKNAILALSASPNKEILLNGLKKYQEILCGGGVYTESGSDMDIPLSKVHLPIRSYNALRRAGCTTIGDTMKIDSLKSVPFVGPAHAEEIISAFKSLGIDTSKWEK